MGRVDVRADGSEKVKYDYDGYYAYIRKGLLSYFRNFSANSHWHDDLEFIYVYEGSMQYNVNGEVVTIEENNGIIVNARQMHFGFSKEKNECDFLCVLMHPLLLCATQSVDRNYVLPIIDGGFSYLLLDKNVPYQREILERVKKIYDEKNSPTAPLRIQRLFYEIWILLCENTLSETDKERKMDKHLTALKNMLSFVQKNYAQKISLDEIAKSGNVSKSTCLAIFKKYLWNTPSNYLINYRLKIASEMLVETNVEILEIALETGFLGASYFSETFKKLYGCSPREYRKRVK